MYLTYIKYAFFVTFSILFIACSSDNKTSSAPYIPPIQTENNETVSIVVPTLEENLTFSIYENIVAESVIGKVIILETGDSNITSFHIDGTGSENFLISSDGEITLRTGAIIDYETKKLYTLEVYATNDAGESPKVSIDIQIKNIDEVPVLGTTTKYLPESAVGGDYVGQVKVISEGDAPIEKFLLVDESAYFNLAANGDVSVKEGATFDYETKKSYSITVKAESSIGPSKERMFNIILTNIVDVPPQLEDTNITISEGVEEQNIIGEINFVEQGDDDNLLITLSGEGNENFIVDSKGLIRVNNNASIDYEKVQSYSLDVNASNGAGYSSIKDLNITVTNIENPFQIEKLQANDAKQADSFGHSVSVSGDYIIVGAPNEDTLAQNAGSAYLYKKDENSDVKQIAKLKASNAGHSDYFGASVGISGSYIVVGAIGEDSNGDDAGSIYVFKIESDSKVTQIAKVQSSDIEAGDFFGSSVAIYNDYILVSAPKEDTSATDAGSVYLFKRNSDANNDVVQIAKFQAGNAGANDLFGTSLSMFENYIVVGTPYEDTTATDAGSVYVFKKNSDEENNVTQIAQIQPDNVEASDFFGNSVSIHSNYIAVGAYGEDSAGEDAGSAYLFKIESDETISQVEDFQASNAGPGDNFATSIAIEGVYVIALAPKEDAESSSDSGMLYIFKRDANDDLLEIKKLQTGDIQSNTLFESVALSGSNIVVGASLNDSEIKDSGNAYLFDFEPKDRIYFYRVPSFLLSREQHQEKFLYHLNAATPSDDTIEFTLSGDDKNDFIIEENSLYFKNYPDYDAPADDGKNNEYTITITAKDLNHNDVSQDVNISVQDAHYLDIATLQAGNAGPDDAFGYSVASEGEYTLAGAPFEDTTDTDAGSAYLFKKASDGTLTQLAKIHDDDNASADQYFGNSVAMSGDYILIGAYGDGDTGAAYLFKRVSDDNISIVAKLEYDTGDDSGNDNTGGMGGGGTAAADNLAFGTSVDIDGDYMVVGAPKDGTGDAGAAYVFKRNADDNITKIGKIEASDPEDNDYFGASVAIENKLIIIGTPGEDTAGTNSGTIFLFEINDTDDAIDRLSDAQADDAQADDSFGTSVGISGDYIVVGAELEDTNATNSGSAYLFKIDSNNGLIQKAKMHDDYATENNYFGKSVSISEEYIAIGAPGKESAFVFKRNSEAANDSSNLGQIQPQIVSYGDFFGGAIAIDKNSLVIGAKNNDTQRSNAGMVYLLEKDLNQE